jgi:glycine cleavage system aminomethyltransferase T
MKHTAFTSFHEAMGAKMVPFAGFYMPVQYEGLNAEHETVRKGVGVFDVSHMGEFWVKGPKAFDLCSGLLQTMPRNSTTERYSTAVSRTTKAVSWTTCLFTA